MKTITSLKRELKNCKALTLIDCSFPNSRLNITRDIALVDTVQFALWTEKDSKHKKSYMYFPKASGYSYNEAEDSFTFKKDGDSFTYKITR